ncbi:MMPL family transporter [Actinoplanes sp. N902-109]|uniref:MMPL family transporter n=1 Tax=Actinoplanes sp. (strain N902-109) TaxID=649831 RepID=UPI0003296778|nr:MMPL family transporter [Actinoplanes sp. N902-109]AGL16395.1 MmpL domain-containing protein [Actinoplanes sp. N902-109]
MRLVLRRPGITLLVALGLAAAAAVLGAGLFPRLSGGGFDDPASESSRARAMMSADLGLPEANFVLLVEAVQPGAGVDDPAVVAAGQQVQRRLAAEAGVQVLSSYWAGPAAPGSPLAGADHRAGLVVATVAGQDDARRQRVQQLADAFTADTPVVRVRTGGDAQADLDVNRQVKDDLARAEAIAVPLTLLLLILVFRSLVAALLPLLVGGLSMVVTFAALTGLTHVMDISVFTVNLVSALGLGLGIDYSLLMVSRFREELAVRADVAAAVTATLSTAGRTVLFSAATIIAALSAMAVFPLYFLRSMAYSGCVVVAVAAAGAVLVLPAVLMLLGRRVNSLRLGLRPPRVSHGGWWHRWARFVMRRPVLTALPVALLIGVLAAPLLGVSFGMPDDQVLPAGRSQARAVGDVIRTDFAADTATGIAVVLPAVPGSGQAARAAAISAYAEQLSRLDGVALVQTATGSFSGGKPSGAGRPQLSSGRTALVQILPQHGGYSTEAQNLVRSIRATIPATVGPALVGGQAAALIDVRASMAAKLPIAAAIVAVGAFVILFLFTGSVVVPVKALLVNALTIMGILGLMVWIFQEGHLSGVLGFTPLPLAITMPMLMFCVAFGLSMDYEAFLLGRIKENHDAGMPTGEAVAAGLGRTGQIVSAAGMLLAITFFAFASSEVSFIQMLGLGTGVAIVLDATLVRGVLVPALMVLMGRFNWWAPAFLRAAHRRFGISDGAGPPPVVLPRRPDPALARTVPAAGDAPKPRAGAHRK